MTAEKIITTKKPLAPDGGWGWMVVLGFSLSNVICIPIIQGFGLLYRDLLRDLGITATDMGIIINTNSSFGYLLGLLNGPVLKTFGYRKVALFGGIVMFCGNLFTSFADSFWDFIIFYGFISSFGFNLIMNAFSLAMNTYFARKRSTATGIAMTITGLGPVVMPFVISFFMTMYGVRGTSMLLAGLSLHAILGGMLLQPVKWHYKEDIKNAEDPSSQQDDNLMPENIQFEGEILVPSRRVSISSDVGRNRPPSIYGSKYSVNSEILKPDSTWWTSSKTSINSLQNNTSVKLTNSVNKLTSNPEEINKLLKDPEDLEIKSSDEAADQTCWQKIIKFFDLDLLKDPGYLSISIGLSIALTGEFNFSLMTPFILGDRDFDTKNTAFLMSIIGTADIISRFCSPFVGNRTKWSAKHLYLFSLVFLMITRFSLTLVSSYKATVIVAVCLGIAKGTRSIYMVLVLPNYVPLEKLASASGLQAMINGMCLFSLGPIVGYVRDLTGNYNYCIHLMNLLTLTTVLLWTCELIYVKTRKKPTSQELDQINS